MAQATPMIAQDAPAATPAPSPSPDEGPPRSSLADLAAKETRSCVVPMRMAPVIRDAMAEEARRRRTTMSRLGERCIVEWLLSLDPTQRNVVPPRAAMTPVEQLVALARRTSGATVIESGNTIVIVVAASNALRGYGTDYATTSPTTSNP